MSEPDPTPWPAWPETDERTLRALGVALLAGRLAVSGRKTAFAPRLSLAANAVAALLGRRHAVLTPSGSSALVVALQALGIGPGDSVLVPATTWIACATAVLRVGAHPVFVDSGPESPGICAGSVSDALARAESQGHNVRALLAVHLYAELLDVEALRRRLPPHVRILEDCSHCHGARRADGRPAGAGGDLAAYSLQVTKLLTSGEGGCVTTDDQSLADRLFALSTDGRRLAEESSRLGACPLVPAGDQHGAHHSMPELSAALLLDQIERFADQCRRRAAGLAAFRRALGGDGPRLIGDPRSFAAGTFYAVVATGLDAAARGSVGDLLDRLHGETGVVAERLYPPMPSAAHYQPATIHGYEALAQDRPPLPWAEHWHRSALILHHHLFLGPPERLEDLARSLRGEPAASRPASGPRQPADAPRVSVVLLTRADRPEIFRAIESVARQEPAIDLELLVVIDGDGPLAASLEEFLARLPARLGRRAVRVTDVDGFPADTAGRVAALRNLAVPLTRAPWVCFLDDDNRWLPDHLATLLDEARASGRPAVHSWRRLEDGEERPLAPGTFPWISDPALARRHHEACVELGLLDDRSPIVRDTVSAVLDGHDYGMVDMGAWLFDRRLLTTLPLETRFDDEDRRRGLTEDDKLLAELRRLAVPTACTRKPTLCYRIGGYSNRQPPGPTD